MRIFIEITVKKWRPWMKKVNQVFSRGNRKVEIVMWPEESIEARRWRTTGELYENPSD